MFKPKNKKLNYDTIKIVILKEALNYEIHDVDPKFYTLFKLLRDLKSRGRRERSSRSIVDELQ